MPDPYASRELGEDCFYLPSGVLWVWKDIPSLSGVQATFQWLKEQTVGDMNLINVFLVKAFHQLKGSLANAPILVYTDPSQPYKLHVSCDGPGGVLYLEHDGHLLPIAFVSWSFTPADKNYPTHKLEFLALKWSLMNKLNDHSMVWTSRSRQIIHSPTVSTHHIQRKTLPFKTTQWASSKVNDPSTWCAFTSVLRIQLRGDKDPGGDSPFQFLCPDVSNKRSEYPL